MSRLASASSSRWRAERRSLRQRGDRCPRSSVTARPASWSPRTTKQLKRCKRQPVSTGKQFVGLSSTASLLVAWSRPALRQAPEWLREACSGRRGRRVSLVRGGRFFSVFRAVRFAWSSSVPKPRGSSALSRRPWRSCRAASSSTAAARRLCRTWSPPLRTRPSSSSRSRSVADSRSPAP